MSLNPFQIIDMRAPAEDTARLLLQAATTQGFLLVDGHSFSQKQVDLLFQLSKEYFTSTPAHEKLQYQYSVDKNYGYIEHSSEQGDPSKAVDFKECFSFGSIDFKNGTYNDMDPAIASQVVTDEASATQTATPISAVPPLFAAHNDAIVESVRMLHELARKIMRLFTIALEIPQQDFFVSRFRPDQKNGCVMRMMHYPLYRNDVAQTSPDTDPSLRVGPHSDYGALTLLMSRKGEQGLEVQLDPSTDEWTSVPFVRSMYQGSAPPFVVNFGDMLYFWTRGVIRSTKHRVRIAPGENRDSDRYSIVFFVHPDANTTLGPIPSPLIQSSSQNDGIEAPPMTAYEYLNTHLRRVNNPK